MSVIDYDATPVLELFPDGELNIAVHSDDMTGNVSYTPIDPKDVHKYLLSSIDTFSVGTTIRSFFKMLKRYPILMEISPFADDIQKKLDKLIEYDAEPGSKDRKVYLDLVITHTPEVTYDAYYLLIEDESSDVIDVGVTLKGIMNLDFHVGAILYSDVVGMNSEIANELVLRAVDNGMPMLDIDLINFTAKVSALLGEMVRRDDDSGAKIVRLTL